jgi:DNA polymerase epsilon subunit 3
MAGRAHADAGSEGLPQANVKRVVKEKLAELAHEHFDDDRKEKDVLVNKDALLAFSESAKIFIHFLSATANEICRESKRQTINADDVLKAVEELDFPEFCEPLKAALAGVCLSLFAVFAYL